MTAQRHDAGARPPEIPQQKLQQRTATDDLRSIRMLRPRYRIRKRGGSVGAGVGEDGGGDLEEYVLRATSGPLDHLRRVAAEVLFDNLENAAWILQGLVTLRRWLQQRPDQGVVRRSRGRPGFGC